MSEKEFSILVVDDSKLILKVVDLYLNYKFNMFFAENTTNAFHEIEHNKIDLILLDVVIPEIGGFALCEKIKNDERFKKIPVIFISGETKSEQIVKGLSVGANDYISKPIIKEELVARVETQIRILETEKLNQEMHQKQLLHAAKLASIGELAAGVGHEINNPLAIIQGKAEIIRSVLTTTPLDMERILKALKTQEEAIKRIVDIVIGLKTYARIDSDHVEVQSLHAIINNTLSLVESIFNNDAVFFEKKLNADVHSILCNPGKVQQVIMNLFSNSKHALQGKEKGIISVETYNDGNLLKFIVSDNGCGIEEKILDKIFNPFFSTKEVGKGTGLGLGIAEEIIKKMKGIITVESKPGMGAKFIITLPTTDQECVSPDQAEKIVFEKFFGNVLVVDDEESIREILREYLESFGLHVDEAVDGLDGLEKIKMNQYDIIFTDLKMPGIRGYELIKEAKKICPLKVKYIVVTASFPSSASSVEHNHLKASIDGYITKPFTQNDIYKALKKVIE